MAQREYRNAPRGQLSGVKVYAEVYIICAMPKAAIPYRKYSSQTRNASPTQENIKPNKIRREYVYLKITEMANSWPYYID